MLAERYPNLADLLLPRDAVHPYPTAGERDAWTGVHHDTRARLLAQGEELLGYAWPALPATLYLDYARTGNRERYQQPYFQRRVALAHLVLSECLKGSGRFLDDILNGLWAICEESTWAIPAHGWHGREGNPPLPQMTAPVIDLFAAETGALLVWTHYLLRPQLDAIHPLVSQRLRHEVAARILRPFITGDFGWMGTHGNRVNNWNPWIISNVLAAQLLLEEDTERRLAGIAKSLRCLDRFIGIHFSDGGCDEGPGYWGRAGASLFDCLELLYGASGGRIDVYDDPLIRNIFRYIYRMHISGDYFVNFADCAPRLRQAGSLLHRMGTRIGDARLLAFSQAFHGFPAGKNKAVASSLQRLLPAVFADPTPAQAAPPLERDVWLDGIQVMTAREQAGSDRGLFLAIKGGHNAESHNHNDIGSFVIYADGRPFLVDAGVETYTAKTFGPQRYEIWTMQSINHNLPTVNGLQQAPGREYAARDVAYTGDDAGAALALDIAPAYPPEAGITRWTRIGRLRRGAEARVEIADAFALAHPIADLQWSLLCAMPPKVEKTGVLKLRDGHRTLRVTLTGLPVTITVDPLPLEDPSLRKSWDRDTLYRVTLRATAPVREGELVMVVGKG